MKNKKAMIIIAASIAGILGLGYLRYRKIKNKKESTAS
jgi:hypothetical protein